MKVSYLSILLILMLVGVFQSCTQQKNPYLVGYKASDFYSYYQKQGFQLDSGVRTFGRDGSKKTKEWFLKKEVSGMEYQVICNGDAEDKLNKISVVVVFKGKGKAAVNTENKAFLEDFINKQYKGEQLSWAHDWLMENLGKESSFKTVDVDFYTTLDKNVNIILLVLYPM